MIRGGRDFEEDMNVTNARHGRKALLTLYGVPGRFITGWRLPSTQKYAYDQGHKELGTTQIRERQFYPNSKQFFHFRNRIHPNPSLYSPTRTKTPQPCSLTPSSNYQQPTTTPFRILRILKLPYHSPSRFLSPETALIKAVVTRACQAFYR